MATIDLNVLANILLETAKVDQKAAERVIASAFKRLNLPPQFVKIHVEPELVPDPRKLRHSIARLQNQIQAALVSSPVRAQLPAPLNALSADRLATVSKGLNRFYKLLNTPVPALTPAQGRVLEGVVTSGQPARGHEARIAGRGAQVLERQWQGLQALGGQLKGAALTQPVSKRLRETAENLQHLMTLVRAAEGSPEFSRALGALFTGPGVRKGAPPLAAGGAGGGPPQPPPVRHGGPPSEPPEPPRRRRTSDIGTIKSGQARVREGLSVLRGLPGLDRVVDLPPRELHVVRTALRRNLQRQQLALGRMIETGVARGPVEALKNRIEATEKAFREVGSRLSQIARTETRARQARTEAVKALRGLSPVGVSGIQSRQELRALKNTLSKAQQAQQQMTARVDLPPAQLARENARRLRLQRALEQVQRREQILRSPRIGREEQARRREAAAAREATFAAETIRRRAIRSMTALGPGAAATRLARVTDPVQLRTLEQQLSAAQGVQRRRARETTLSPQRAQREADRASLFGQQLEAVRNRLKELGRTSDQLSRAQRKEAAARERARRQAERARTQEHTAQTLRQRAIRSMTALGPGTAATRLTRVTDPVHLRMLEQQLTAARAVQTRLANAPGLSNQQAARESRRAALISDQLKAIQSRLRTLGQAPTREARAQQRIAEQRAVAQPLRREAIQAVWGLGRVSQSQDIQGLERAHSRLSRALTEERRLLRSLRGESRATRESQERQVRRLEGHLGRVRDQMGALRREEAQWRREQETHARRQARGTPAQLRAEEGLSIVGQAGGLGAVSAIPREQLSLAREGLERQTRELRSRQAQLLHQLQDPQVLSDRGAVRRLRRDLDQTNRSLRDTDQALRQVRDRMNGFRNITAQAASTLRLFFRYAVGYGALYEVLGAVTALARGVADLDQQLHSIAAIARTSSQELNQIEAAIKRVATTTQFSVSEVAQSAQTLAQAGFRSTEINQALESVALFASATNSALTTSADLISTVRNVFKDLSDRTIADQLTTAVNISKLTADDLQTILSRGLQVSRGFNLASEQFLAAVTVLRNAGVRASTVSTGLRQALLEIFSPSKKLIDTLRKRYAELGEEIGAPEIRQRFFGFTQTDNPLLNVLRELRRLGLGGSAQMDFSRVFNVRAMNALQVLVRDMDQLSENTVRLGVGSGSALKGAERQMESFNNSMSNLGATITTVTANLTDGLLPALSRVASRLTETLKGLNATIDSIREGSGAGLGSALAVGGTVGTLVASRAPFGTFGRAVAGVGAGVGAAAAGTLALAREPTKAMQQFLEVIAWIAGAGVLLRGFRLGSITTLRRDLEAARSIFDGFKLIGRAARQFPLFRTLAGLTALFTILKKLGRRGEETAADREVQIIAGEQALARTRSEEESRRAVFAPFDPNVSGSQAEIAQRVRRAAEESDRVLVQLFGDRAEAVRDLVVDFSRFEQASPQGRRLLEEIIRVSGKQLSEIEPRLLNQVGHTLRDSANAAEALADTVVREFAESVGRGDLRSTAFQQAFKDLGLALNQLRDPERPVVERLKTFETLSEAIFEIGETLIHPERTQRQARSVARKKVEDLVTRLASRGEDYQKALDALRSQYLTEGSAHLDDLVLGIKILEEEIERQSARARTPAPAPDRTRRFLPGMGLLAQGPTSGVSTFGREDIERLEQLRTVFKDVQQVLDEVRAQVIEPADNALKRSTSQFFEALQDALGVGGVQADTLKRQLESEGFETGGAILPEDARFEVDPTTGKLTESRRLQQLRALFKQYTERLAIQAEELEKFLLETIKDDPELEEKLADVESRIKMARRRREFGRIAGPEGLLDELFALRLADLNRRLIEVEAQEERAETLPGATHQQRQRLAARRHRLQGKIRRLGPEKAERVDEAVRAGELLRLDTALVETRNALRLLDRDLSLAVATGASVQKIVDLTEEQARLKEKELELERDRMIVSDDRKDLAEDTFVTERALFAAQRAQLLAQQLRQARQAEMERDLARITTRADAFRQRFGTGISRAREVERLQAELGVRERAALRIFSDEIPKLQALGPDAAAQLMQTRAELAELRNEINGLDGDIARLNQGSMQAFAEGFNLTRLANGLRTLDSASENLANTVGFRVVQAVDDLGNTLADVALEGESLFGSLNNLAHNFFKDLTRLFIRSEINALFSALKGGGEGSILGTVFGMFTGGGGAEGSAKSSVIKAATGGIIRGPGSDTSDSIPGTVHDTRGHLKGLIRVSDGEAILNANAVRALGEETVHAFNRTPARALRFASGGVPGARPRPQSGGMSSHDLDRALSQMARPSGPVPVKVQLSEGALNRTLRDWLEEELSREAAFR